MFVKPSKTMKNYLRSSVKESAASTISGLSLTRKHYSVAVSLRRKRFDPFRKFFSGHMDALASLPPVTNARDLKAVRQLCDEVEANTRALEAMGCKSEQYSKLSPTNCNEQKYLST